MAVWGIRAGASGENENLAIEQSIVVIGWSGLGDLAGVQTPPYVDGRTA